MNATADYLLPASTESLRPFQVTPTDSTSALLGLMLLSRGTSQDAPDSADGDPLDGIIPHSVLHCLWTALHVRDVKLVRHSRRVAQLSVALAQHLGWEGRLLKCLEIAALLHDMGKLAVPDTIRFKPGKLTPDEVELMSLHYDVALNVLQACRVDPLVLEMVCHAHATFSGVASSRMSWRDRSLGARILAIADAYESLSTAQAYRPARSHEEILTTLTSTAGKEFDGNVVNALARYVSRHGLPFNDEYDFHPMVERYETANDQLQAAWMCQVMSQLYLLESLYDGFFVVDADVRINVWNRGLEVLLNRPAHDMLGKSWTSGLLGYVTEDKRALPEMNCPMHHVLRGGGAQATEMQLVRTDGRMVYVELQSVPLLDEQGRLHGVIEILRDLTRSQRRAPQNIRELQRAATRDALTSVANRGELETQLTSMIVSQERQPGEPFSVIFLDADHFKSVNDTYGHALGDQVLIELARLLEQETYSGELVARYGGEEFVVLCPGTNIEDGFRKAERLRNAIRSAKIGGVDGLQVTASFGVTQYEPGDSVESVLRRADQALYRAKQSGRDCTCSESIPAASTAAPAEAEQVRRGADPFVMSTCFTAVITEDMAVYKVGGYVQGVSARVLDVTHRKVVLGIGQARLFGGWGREREQQPVQVELLFEQLPGLGRGARTRIGVTIRPRGRIRHAEVFQSRAHQVLRELKQYFAAD
jgi:diguanylate cyclase (GGDEF)-like protein/PAS domain S-box-containing protein